MLLLGAAPKGKSPDAGVLPFKWDVPPIVAEVDIPGITWSAGVPVKMHAVVVKGRVEDLMRHFVESFSRQGLYVLPPHEVPASPYPSVTGHDPDARISYTVIFQPSSQKGLVTLVLGEANVGAVDARQAQGPDFAPLYPGARSVVRTNVEGLNTVAYVAPASELEVTTFYKESLSKAGFKPEGQNAWRKGNEVIRIQMQRLDGQLNVMLSRSIAPAQPLGIAPDGR